jgi:hypothetical protein
MTFGVRLSQHTGINCGAQSACLSC